MRRTILTVRNCVSTVFGSERGFRGRERARIGGADPLLRPCPPCSSQRNRLVATQERSERQGTAPHVAVVTYKPAVKLAQIETVSTASGPRGLSNISCVAETTCSTEISRMHLRSNSHKLFRQQGAQGTAVYRLKLQT
jgi:hypothetical protein